MKLVVFLLSFLCVVASCDRFKSKHPQATGANDSLSLDEKSIQAYADSIKSTLANFDKDTSLIYAAGDYWFYVTKYFYNNEPVLYIENGSSGDYGFAKRYYYLRNNGIVLFEERLKNSVQDSTAFATNKNFYRNNTHFLSMTKNGKTEAELNKAGFRPYRSEKINPAKKLERLENALQQKGEFELLFSSITGSPEERYLLLNNSKAGPQEVAVKVENEDDFIKELVANPDKYKGQKLDFNWSLKDSTEVIYIGRKPQD